MSNSLELTLTDINISGINITVNNRTSTDILTKEIVKVRKYDEDNLNFKDANYKIKSSATTTNAIIVAIADDGKDSDFSQDDLLLIQIIDTDGKTSDRISLDFKEKCELENTAITKYEMPEQTGNYKLKLLSINDIELSNIESEEFDLCSTPGNDSTITINKSYLTRFAGQICLVTNVLTDVTANGNYQIEFSATKS